MTELRELLEGSKAKVEALQADDHSEEAKRGIAQLGGAYRALGMWDEALETFDRGLRLFQREDNLAGVSEFLTWKSNVFFHSGTYQPVAEVVVRP